MKEKSHIKLTRLIVYTLVLSNLMVITQCRKSNNPDIIVFSSSLDGDRLIKKPDGSFTTDSESPLPVITMDEGTVSKN